MLQFRVLLHMLLLQILEKLIGLQNEALKLEKTCKK